MFLPGMNAFMHLVLLRLFFSLPKLLLGSNECLIPHIKSYPDMTYVLGLKYCMFLWRVDFVQISVIILGFSVSIMFSFVHCCKCSYKLHPSIYLY